MQKSFVMEIYHGSYMAVEHPKIIKGRFEKDFGTGFYCTTLKKQARRWAGKFDTSVVSIYEYVENVELRILRFETMTDDWLDFIVACRSGVTHDYDIVVGAMADDQIYNYVSDYVNGILTREQFWVLAKFKYPTQQIAFCTDAALTCLTFLDSETL